MSIGMPDGTPLDSKTKTAFPASTSSFVAATPEMNPDSGNSGQAEVPAVAMLAIVTSAAVQVCFKMLPNVELTCAQYLARVLPLQDP